MNWPPQASERASTTRSRSTSRKPMGILTVWKGISQSPKESRQKFSPCPCTPSLNFISRDELSRKFSSHFPYSVPVGGVRTSYQRPHLEQPIQPFCPTKERSGSIWITPPMCHFLRQSSKNSRSAAIQWCSPRAT